MEAWSQSAPPWTAWAEAQLWRASALKVPDQTNGQPRPEGAARDDLSVAAQAAARQAASLDPAFGRAVQIARMVWRDGMRDHPALQVCKAFAARTGNRYTLIMVAEALQHLTREMVHPFFVFCPAHADGVPCLTPSLCATEAILAPGGWAKLADTASGVVIAAGGRQPAISQVGGPYTQGRPQ